MGTVGIVRKSVRVLGYCIAYYGLISFVAQGLIGMGAFGQLRGVSWPVGEYVLAEKLPDGRFAIPAETGRIQIYSSRLQFEYGWPYPLAGSAEMRLASDGTLHCYKLVWNSWWSETIFDLNGTVLGSNKYPKKGMEFPGQSPVAIQMPVQHWSWWTIPLRGPPYAIAYLIGGVIVVTLTMTAEDRAAHAAWLARRRR